MAAKKPEEIKRVSGFPAKSFFVTMLTRDIELQDAVLDLLDNCVDGAIRSRGDVKRKRDSLAGFWAHIKFNEDKFIIEDNCGGIPWPLAKEYAFRMGRPEGTPVGHGMIGVVGIGMKRAIFKMGRECFVHSNHKKDTFLVSIPQTWFNDDKDWEFDAKRETSRVKQLGTIVEISELTDPTRLAFKNGSSFRDGFDNIVGEAYSYLIEKGFKIKVNGVEVKRKPVKLCFEAEDEPKKKGDLIRPYVYKAKLNGVNVFLAVGYRSRFLTQEEQDDEKEATFAAKEAGWTIVCNDRVVLSNDRTIKTGWGIAGIPNFHNQFSCIAGIVEFKADDMSKLPVTTTKRGIDTGKDVYTIVRQRMQEGMKHFTRNTNKWKGFEAELKNRFDRTTFIDLQQLRHKSSFLPLNPLRGEGVQVQYTPSLPIKKQVSTTRRIAYSREIRDINLVSRYVFDEERQPNDVGEASFDRVLAEARK